MMKSTIKIIAVLLALLSFASCHKDKEFGNEKPEVGEVEITPVSNQANFTWQVAYSGKFQTGVEISNNEALTDSRIVEGTKDGEIYKASVSSLEASTKYYYRIVVWNKLSRQEGEVKSFTTAVPEPTTDHTFKVNGVSFTMKRVEGGTFWMGAQSTDSSGQNYDSEAYNVESPVHSVTLSTFYIGETEVTQELWQSVMGSNPSHFSGTNLPVEQVSWNEIVNEFLPALNAATGQNFRLPTEAEWEYAARGGNQGHGYTYAGSNTLDDVGWYGNNSNSQTHPAGTKSPNELGLYDMSGNVRDWCQDWYGSYSGDSQTNPQGPSSGSYRVLRGGGWNSHAGYCRVSYRINNHPGYGSVIIGFRLALPE